MKLVRRSDRVTLNLDAATSFRPMGKNLLVEYPNEEYYIIFNYSVEDINDNRGIFDIAEREFKGWPTP